MKYNMARLGHRNGSDLLRERVQKVNKEDCGVVCDNCNGLFSRSWFSGHRKQCMGDSVHNPKAIPAKVFFDSDDLSEDLKREVLGKFATDEVGELCQSDQVIITIGSRVFRKTQARQDKVVEVRRSVMADMRRLGSL